MHPLAKLLAFALLYFVLQGQLACYSRYLLIYSLCIPVPYEEKDICFLVFYNILQLFIEQFNLSFFSTSVRGIDFDYYDV